MTAQNPEPRENDDDLPGWSAMSLDGRDFADDTYADAVGELVTEGDEPDNENEEV